VTAVDDLAAWLTQIWDERETRERERLENGPEWLEEAAAFGAEQPDLMLARIAADRQILAEYTSRGQDANLMLGPDCRRQREWSGLRLAVRILASTYADRPGYQEAWRPA
jgi:hypothetical protein